jgi:two-component system sensor histidine kinase KdpD
MQKRPPVWRNYLISIIAVILAAALMAPFALQINTTTVALVFLLAILFIATAFGSRPAFLASLLAVLCFNFFFLPPLHTFTISDPQNWIALGAFLITALTAGKLSSYARRRAEESEQRRRQIEDLYNELQGAFAQASQAEALRQSEKLKSSLLDAVTHDLRTPLTSIKASVTALIDDRTEKVLDEEGQNEFLEIINEESDRLNSFIEGMVGLAKIEANALHLRKTWSAVDEIVNNALERAKNRLGSHHIVFETESEMPNLFIDAASLSEVIYTLLDNAAKYSPPRSTIRISAARVENENIEISVEDQGRGIPGEMREKVFGKFFRRDGEDIHNTAGGLGLGLAIARGIVESQNGTIWIEDGRGEFKIRVVFRVPIGDE